MDPDRELLTALHQNKKDMASLREAVERLGKDLGVLTSAVQDLSRHLAKKAKPVIPTPPRLRAIRER
jgi:hypothetical protein